jgi:hypothetical protein
MQGGGSLWQIISQGDPGAKGWIKQVERTLIESSSSFNRAFTVP